MKTKYKVVTTLKKYKEIDGYTFEAVDDTAARGHVRFKLGVKFSQYEISQAMKRGKLQIKLA